MEMEQIKERYELSAARLRELLGEESVKEPYRDYFKQVSGFILDCCQVMDAVLDGSFPDWDGDRLRGLNQTLYRDVLPEHYETSYANPAYAVKTLGEEYGQLLCFLYGEIRGDIIYAFEGRLLEMVIYNEALIEIYNLFEGPELPGRQEVHDVLYWCISDYCDQTLPYRVREGVDPSLGLHEADYYGQ